MHDEYYSVGTNDRTMLVMVGFKDKVISINVKDKVMGRHRIQHQIPHVVDYVMFVSASK